MELNEHLQGESAMGNQDVSMENVTTKSCDVTNVNEARDNFHLSNDDMVKFMQRNNRVRSRMWWCYRIATWLGVLLFLYIVFTEKPLLPDTYITAFFMVATGVGLAAMFVRQGEIALLNRQRKMMLGEIPLSGISVHIPWVICALIVLTFSFVVNFIVDDYVVKHSTKPHSSTTSSSAVATSTYSRQSTNPAISSQQSLPKTGNLQTNTQTRSTVTPQTPKPIASKPTFSMPISSFTPINQVQAAAAQGDINAQVELGRRYQRGEDVEKNYDEAVKLFKAAAEKGSKRAQFEIALCYLTGMGLPKDNQIGMQMLHALAEGGDSGAQYQLGWRYERGISTKKSIEDAIFWYEKAAAQGNPGAKEKLKDLKNRLNISRNLNATDSTPTSVSAREEGHVSQKLNTIFNRAEKELNTQTSVRETSLIQAPPTINTNTLMSEFNRRLSIAGHTFKVTSLTVLNYEEKSNLDVYRLQVTLNQPIYSISKTQSSWIDPTNQQVRINAPAWTEVSVYHPAGATITLKVQMNKSSNRYNPDGFRMEEEGNRGMKTQDDVNRLAERGFVIMANSAADRQWKEALNSALELKRAQYLDEKLRHNNKQAANRYNENRTKLNNYSRGLQTYAKKQKGKVHDSLTGVPRAPSPRR